MARPPLFPDQSAAGIAIDPRTLERVIPESKRSDGTVRKQLKIRPGFTPQEDVSRFRGSRQQAMDATALPKGHILGWVAPSAAASPKGQTATPPPNKNAKKRANARAKKNAEKAAIIKDNWEDEEGEGEDETAVDVKVTTEESKEGSSKTSGTNDAATGLPTEDKPNRPTAPDSKLNPSSADQSAVELSDKLKKLQVK
jgi:partner of Y14 and mago protein